MNRVGAARRLGTVLTLFRAQMTCPRAGTHGTYLLPADRAQPVASG